MANELKLSGVQSKLRGIRKSVPGLPPNLYHLANYMAKISNDELIPEGVITSINLAMYDAKKKKGRLLKETTEIPKELVENYYEIFSTDLAYFPLIIDEIASEDFAKRFRKLFKEMFFEPVPAKK